MAEKEFDLIVIGTGSAGSTVARRCRNAGWKVAIIDSRPFGGTCSQRGCDPKKILIAAAEAVDWQRRLAKRGVKGEVSIDWPELMAAKREYTEPIPERTEEKYADLGLIQFHGRARFTGPNSIAVGDDELRARHIHIATGMRHRPLGIKGEEHLSSSTDFLNLEEMPRRVLFVGGGYISMEFAHLAVRAGADVTILQRSDHILKQFDQDLANLLIEYSRKIGIKLHLNSCVDEIRKTETGYQVGCVAQNTIYEADLVVHGAGRVPEIDELDLEAGNVVRADTRLRGIKVNEYFQSVSNPAVYAAGDCAETGPPLTPVAGVEGVTAAKNLLEGNKHTINYDGIPSAVFTIPPLSGVGMLESEAKAAGLEFDAKFDRTENWFSYRRRGEECSAYKTLIEKKTGRILGAHFLGSHAEEIVNVFAVAMRHGLTRDQLRDQFYAYPTHSSDIKAMI